MGEDVWWWPQGDAARERAVLFFPPSGGEPTAARGLADHLAGLRFGVLQMPGRGARFAEQPPTDVEELIGEVAASVAELDGSPPVLVGHSFGGLLGYGVAARLESLGVAVGSLIVVTAASPPHWAAELAADRVAHPDDVAGFVARRSAKILDGGGVPTALADHAEYAARARELVMVDVRLSECGFRVVPVHTPVTSIVASSDTVLDPTATDGWADVAAGGFTRVEVPGDHFFYRSAPQRLAARLRMEVQGLDGGYETL